MYRYYNKNTGQVVEQEHPSARLEYLQNWVTVESDEHLAELQSDGNQRSGRGNLLGSANVGDRVEERHQVPEGTLDPKVEFTEPSKTQLPGQHPDAEDFHPEKQPEVITLDPSQQVEPKTGPEKHQFTTVETPAAADPDIESTTSSRGGATPEPETNEGPNPSNRPARSATKSEWVNWAVECGADRTEAENMTKQDLVDVYGE